MIKYIEPDAELISQYKIYDNYYIVLALRNQGLFHEYVVWYSDQKGNCHTGRYVDEESRAREIYFERIKTAKSMYQRAA